MVRSASLTSRADSVTKLQWTLQCYSLLSAARAAGLVESAGLSIEIPLQNPKCLESSPSLPHPQYVDAMAEVVE